jgi:hypothetical protein
MKAQHAAATVRLINAWESMMYAEGCMRGSLLDAAKKVSVYHQAQRNAKEAQCEHETAFRACVLGTTDITVDIVRSDPGLLPAIQASLNARVTDTEAQCKAANTRREEAEYNHREAVAKYRSFRDSLITAVASFKHEIAVMAGIRDDFIPYHEIFSRL